MTTGDPICPICGLMTPHIHDSAGISPPWTYPLSDDKKSLLGDNVIKCPHVKHDRMPNDWAMIDLGDKSLLLCKVCDNVLRGHYIGDLTKLTLNIRGKL
jgi:hypothetical protein